MGMTMGTKLTSQCAKLFMNHMEKEFLENGTFNSVLYLHYIHDIFIIWTEHVDSFVKPVMQVKNYPWLPEHLYG